MWTGKGRSGIGDTNIQGTWEDWDGLSPNGRQYKNAITQETRNLSGQEYWNARKADYLSQETEVWKDGKANIAGFADSLAKPKATKKPSAFNSIMLADRNYSRLCGLSEQLDQELDAGQIDLESYCAARKNIDQRLAKAWARVQRERGWEGQDEPFELERYPSEGLEFTLDPDAPRRLSVDLGIIPKESVFSNLSDGNSFKIFYAQVLTGYKALSKLLNNTKEILKEGLV
jgi:hypothetical protein